MPEALSPSAKQALDVIGPAPPPSESVVRPEGMPTTLRRQFGATSLSEAAKKALEDIRPPQEIAEGDMPSLLRGDEPPRIAQREPPQRPETQTIPPPTFISKENATLQKFHDEAVARLKSPPTLRERAIAGMGEASDKFITTAAEKKAELEVALAERLEKRRQELEQRTRERVEKKRIEEEAKTERARGNRAARQFAPQAPEPLPAEKTPAVTMEPAATPETSVVSGVGFIEDIGRGRPRMEDAHTIIENLGGRTSQAFFAIYDGHGRFGVRGADIAAEGLHNHFLEQLNAGLGPKEALHYAYLQTHLEIKNIKIDTGTTAITAYFLGSKLFVANAGDTRAVLNRGGNALRLSYDHKPNAPEEQRRLEVAGATVTPPAPYDPAYRVSGYAISRALGNLNEEIIPDPYIKEEEITPPDTHLILACDGVWDVMSDQEAVDLIKDTKDPQLASELLRDEALRRTDERRTQGELIGDNITVIVVGLAQLEHQEQETIPPPPSPQTRP